MQWLEITIKANSSSIDFLEAKLTAIGYEDFIIEDSTDFQEFLENNTQYWDFVDEDLSKKMENISQIRLYIENDEQAFTQLETLKSAMDDLRNSMPDVDFGSLEISIENMQEEDWENNWKQYYHPIEIGEKLIVVPEWQAEENKNERIPVILDPGMIFGTGAHASTQMVLEELEKHMKSNAQVVDLGSGSGILSIASLLLGAESAIGVDIDPLAEKIARDNAALNGLKAPEFQAITGNVIGDAAMMEKLAVNRYDIVLANIVADVIIPLSKVVPQLVKQDGVFICSGIINTRYEDVCAALKANGLEIVHTDKRKDWYCIVAKTAAGTNQ